MTQDKAKNQGALFSLLQISGPDSEKLLQGQLTCDVVKLTSESWTLGACCTAKGRMIANFLIARNQDLFILRLPEEQATALKTHLGKYAVFYKVNMEVSDALVSQVVSPSSQSRNIQWKSTEPLQAELEWPDGRKEYWGIEVETEKLDPTAIQDRDIESGIVWVTSVSQESWIPQHIGWDKLDGINFKKGCYTGQEVVARLQYLGKSKRQLMRIETSDADVSSAELSVKSAVSLSDKNVGEVASWINGKGLIISSAEIQADGANLECEGVKLSLVEAVYPAEA